MRNYADQCNEGKTYKLSFIYQKTSSIIFMQ
jgi:hypothetical protein